MMGLSTERAPSPSLVVPYFAFSSISFLVMAILLLFTVPELKMHFFNPKLLAITHIAALGWITMIIMGALYQLIPVIFETGLYSQNLGKANFYLFISGFFGMVVSFWTMHFRYWLFISGLIVLMAIVLFSFNIYKSILISKKSNAAGKLVLASVFWLLLTGLLGFLLTLNYTFPFLHQEQFNLLKTHAHFGMIGWLLFLVMGVSSVLIPMFLVSHDLKEIYIKRALVICNLALVLASIDWILLAGTRFMIVYIIVFLWGFSYYLRFIFDSFRKKVRKLDLGMKHTMVSFLFLVLPVLLAISMSLSGWVEIKVIQKMVIPYGISIFLGFFSNLILGQLYKTLPFIIWLHRYKHLVGKAEIPMPRDLYSEKLGQIQYYVYLTSMLSLFLGFLSDLNLLFYTSMVLLVVTALLYNVNVFTIIFRKK